VLDRWPPHARAHRNLAAELKLANRRDEEVVHLRAAVKDLPEIRNVLGLELLALGRNAEAHAREAARLTPNDPAAHNLLRLALIGAQKMDDAIAEFRASLALQPDNNDAAGYLDRTLKAIGQ
jgi:Flp pilus assembly protein TadD